MAKAAPVASGGLGPLDRIAVKWRSGRSVREQRQPPSSVNCLVVEVAGIEPASFGTKPGLLRAQPANEFLSPSSHTGKLLTG